MSILSFNQIISIFFVFLVLLLPAFTKEPKFATGFLDLDPSSNASTSVEFETTTEVDEVNEECGVYEELSSLVNISFIAVFSKTGLSTILQPPNLGLKPIGHKQARQNSSIIDKLTFKRLSELQYAVLIVRKSPIVILKELEVHKNHMTTFTLEKSKVEEITVPSKTKTCHYNHVKNWIVCVEFDESGIIIQNLHVEQNALGRRDVVTTKLPKPMYLNFDKLHSYADEMGNNFLLVHHKLQWIYKIDIDELMRKSIPFLKTYQLINNLGNGWEFFDFSHADQVGIVSVYYNEEIDKYRYIYSIFNEVTGMKSFCIGEADHFLSVAVFANKIIPVQTIVVVSPVAEALRETLGIPLPTEPNFWSSGFLFLFVAAFSYLAMFLLSLLVPSKKASLVDEMLDLEREMSNMSSIIEPVVLHVHKFLKNNPIKKHKKK